MELEHIIQIVIIHWIADFVFQDGSWAVAKSKSIKALLKHTTVYTIICFLGLLAFSFSFQFALLFSLTTFVFHTGTDFFTSKWVRRKFDKGELGDDIPNLGAFSLIGMDQVLHYFQLFITFKILF